MCMPWMRIGQNNNSNGNSNATRLRVQEEDSIKSNPIPIVYLSVCPVLPSRTFHALYPHPSITGCPNKILPINQC